jgi:energy-coupling factor transporter transmembrane protein EcfT
MSATAASAVPQREGKEYVRTFLFSMKIDSPLAKLHVVSKLVSILLVSLILVKLMNMTRPDPVGVVVLAVLSLFSLYLGGVIAWLFRSYLVVLFPMLGTLIITWLVFNPDPGTRVFFEFPLYAGSVHLQLSLGLLVFFAAPWIYFRFTRRIFWGLVGGIALIILLNRLDLNPSLHLTEFRLFQPIPLIISDKNLVVAVTKVFGYATMVFASLTLVMTTRDAEVAGTLRQLRMPYSVSFFASVMLRSLSMAVLDYGTIRQAQVARGVDLQDKSIFARLLDLARISVPLIVTMIRRSTEVADAVMARGMTLLSANPVTFRETRPLNAIDVLVMAMFVGLTVVVYGFNFNLTHLLGILPWT